METASLVTEVPGWLARSSIYKRIPVHLRQKLDAALLNRTSDAMLETIASEFKLSTYGISTPTLKKYAKKLEQWVRPHSRLKYTPAYWVACRKTTGGMSRMVAK